MTLEAVPTRPGAVDGFYSEDTQDGFYDEYPEHGFYGSVGYAPEFKPLHRATYTLEAVPERPGSLDGFYSEGLQEGFYDEYPEHGFYGSVGYLSEFKPPRRA